MIKETSGQRYWVNENYYEHMIGQRSTLEGYWAPEKDWQMESSGCGPYMKWGKGTKKKNAKRWMKMAKTNRYLYRTHLGALEGTKIGNERMNFCFGLSTRLFRIENTLRVPKPPIE